MLLSQENIASIIGFGLFILSEVLPFINIKANGIFETLILGVKNAFDHNLLPRSKDIELAQTLVTTQDDFANIVNTINSNPYIKDIIINLIKNPTTANNIKAVQNNPELSHVVTTLLFNGTELSSVLKSIN
jgi:hypothetical protein